LATNRPFQFNVLPVMEWVESEPLGHANLEISTSSLTAVFAMAQANIMEDRHVLVAMAKEDWELLELA